MPVEVKLGKPLLVKEEEELATDGLPLILSAVRGAHKRITMDTPECIDLLTGVKKFEGEKRRRRRSQYQYNRLH